MIIWLFYKMDTEYSSSSYFGLNLLDKFCTTLITRRHVRQTALLKTKSRKGGTCTRDDKGTKAAVVNSQNTSGNCYMVDNN